MTISLEPLEKALETLESGLKTDVPSDLERDGIIQRFEYCIELSWKTAKKKLDQNTIETDSPREVFRQMAKLGWIADAAIWFEFLNARNKTSHMYREDIAKEIFAIVPSFLIEAKLLLKKLKALA